MKTTATSILMTLSLACAGLIFQARAQQEFGRDNSAAGHGALEDLTSGVHNTAAGHAALNNNTTGRQNTATGARALVSNTTGGDNTAAGYLALRDNTTATSTRPMVILRSLTTPSAATTPR